MTFPDPLLLFLSVGLGTLPEAVGVSEARVLERASPREEGEGAKGREARPDL